jgi:protein-L-isoaspartate(D-aspartate) O-methyltransferase
MKSQKELADYLLFNGYIKSQKLYDVFLKIDRKNFLLDEQKNFAYFDTPLSIGYNQTISAPHMYAIMIENLELNENKKLKILEIGTGSGYGAALLKTFCKNSFVFSMEINKPLLQFAAKNLKKSGFDIKIIDLNLTSNKEKKDLFNLSDFENKNQIVLIYGNGFYGFKKAAPFDRIVVTAAAYEFPKELLEQLNKNGILILPISLEDGLQHLIKIKKLTNRIEQTDLGLVSFVPLVKDLNSF